MSTSTLLVLGGAATLDEIKKIGGYLEAFCIESAEEIADIIVACGTVELQDGGVDDAEPIATEMERYQLSTAILLKGEKDTYGSAYLFDVGANDGKRLLMDGSKVALTLEDALDADAFRQVVLWNAMLNRIAFRTATTAHDRASVARMRASGQAQRFLPEDGEAAALMETMREEVRQKRIRLADPAAF